MIAESRKLGNRSAFFLKAKMWRETACSTQRTKAVGALLMAIALSGCGSDQPEKAERKPGDPMNGSWFEPSEVSGCFRDQPVIFVDGAGYHARQHGLQVTMYREIKQKSVGNDLVFEGKTATVQGKNANFKLKIQYSDTGNYLVPVSQWNNDKSVKISGHYVDLSTLARCSEISVLGSIKLLLGIEAAYDENDKFMHIQSTSDVFK